VLGEDDRRSVFEKSPLSHHFTTREEELFKIGAVHFKHLATLLSQGVEGGSRMLPMLRLDPLCPNFPPFMLDVLEVVDSLAELLKCLPHESNTNQKPLLETIEIGQPGFWNWIVRFCQDRQQSGAPPGFDEVASPPTKRRLVRLIVLVLDYNRS
jgi:hypothetical protein